MGLIVECLGKDVPFGYCCVDLVHFMIIGHFLKGGEGRMRINCLDMCSNWMRDKRRTSIYGSLFPKMMEFVCVLVINRSLMTMNEMEDPIPPRRTT